LAAAGSQGLLLLGIRLSRPGASGGSALALARERFLWGSVVVSVVCTVGGAFAVHAGISVLGAGGTWGADAVVAYGVLGFAGLLAALSVHGSLRQYLLVARGRGFRDLLVSRDPTVAMTLLDDGLGLLGILLAAACLAAAQATGEASYDGVGALLIGALLAARGVLAAIRLRRILLGDASAHADQERIRRILALQPGVERVLDVTAVHLAPNDVLLGLSLDFRPDVGPDEAHRILHSLEYRIREAMPHMKRVYIDAGTVLRFWEQAGIHP
jgi:divalent metal cation (Fe/Co/Zn/Cd) transporter